MNRKERLEWLQQESRRRLRAGWQSSLARRNAQEALKAKHDAGDMPIRDLMPVIAADKEAEAMEGVDYR